MFISVLRKKITLHVCKGNEMKEAIRVVTGSFVVALAFAFAPAQADECTLPEFECPNPETFCGDGIIQEGEQCDDGNDDNGDGCSAVCVIEGGDEGCTPGYWKQAHHFDSWPAPYTPDTPFGSVFEDAFPGMTLRDVLWQGGGGLRALGRHTVAALLNGGDSGVDYALSDAAVISIFNDVYPGTRREYIDVKNGFFEINNEQSCPLN